MSMADRDGWIWYDGKMVPWRDATTHVLTHTLHYGLGVFEGVRAYKTADGPAIFRLRDHTDRLFRSAQIFGMKIPLLEGRDRRGAAGLRPRQQARILLPAADRVLRLARDGRRRQVQPGARRDRGLAVGRLSRRRRPREGHPRQDLVVHASPSEHHDVQRQGRLQLRGLDPREPGSDARRLRGGDAARSAGLRLPGLRRERVHRPRRQAAHAGPLRRRAQRHHARHDHHVRGRARHSRASSGGSRATRSTSPTRRSSPAPPPRSRRSANTTTARSARAGAAR